MIPPGGTGQAAFGGGGMFGGAPTFGSPTSFGSASFSSPFGGALAVSSPPAGSVFGSAQGNNQATGGFAG